MKLKYTFGVKDEYNDTVFYAEKKSIESLEQEIGRWERHETELKKIREECHDRDMATTLEG